MDIDCETGPYCDKNKTAAFIMNVNSYLINKYIFIVFYLNKTIVSDLGVPTLNNYRNFIQHVK